MSLFIALRGQFSFILPKTLSVNAKIYGKNNYHKVPFDGHQIAAQCDM